MSDVYDIIVIGGGPCGIATVVEARANGLKKVLLLEKGDNHSQTIRKFYKEKGLLHVVNGERAIEPIVADIKALVNSL